MDVRTITLSAASVDSTNWYSKVGSLSVALVALVFRTFISVCVCECILCEQFFILSRRTSEYFAINLCAHCGISAYFKLFEPSFIKPDVRGAARQIIIYAIATLFDWKMENLPIFESEQKMAIIACIGFLLNVFNNQRTHSSVASCGLSPVRWWAHCAQRTALLYKLLHRRPIMPNKSELISRDKNAVLLPCRCEDSPSVGTYISHASFSFICRPSLFFLCQFWI